VTARRGDFESRGFRWRTGQVFTGIDHSGRRVQENVSGLQFEYAVRSAPSPGSKLGDSFTRAIILSVAARTYRIAPITRHDFYLLLMNSDAPPPWALSILRGPDSAEAAGFLNGLLVTALGHELGRFESGVLRFPVRETDEGIAFYRKMGGAHFHERRAVPFAMSSLDTPVYHGYLYEVRPADLDAVIVDVGGGDGRNARPWLEWGYRRVVVVDPAAEALVRFRRRVAAEKPEWLDRLLLIEADARTLPLAIGCAQTVLAVEALECLNEDFERGLRDCARVLADNGKLLISERDYESALVMRLLYYGFDGMMETARTRAQWDRGTAEHLLRTRTFTEAELVDAVAAAGLEATSVRGTTLIAGLLGWANGRGMLEGQEKHLPEVRELLSRLGRTGVLRRSHVVIAERTGVGR
jgi:SAM-dependent methyltransferase